MAIIIKVTRNSRDAATSRGLFLSKSMNTHQKAVDKSATSVEKLALAVSWKGDIEIRLKHRKDLSCCERDSVLDRELPLWVL